MTAVTALRRPVRLVETDAHEGPVYAGEALYFTSLPREGRVAIRRLDLASREVTTLREESNMANGMCLDAGGRLLVCEQGTRSEPARIARVDPRTGAHEVVVDEWRGLPFNSPNDVVVARDGAIWFTDPSYGFLQGFRPRPRLGDRVYRHDPRSGRTDVVAEGFDKPNGIALSPGEETLYVTDSGAPRHVMAFPMRDGRPLGPGRPLAVVTPGSPDGIKCDAGGRVYVSSLGGVQVHAANGDPLGRIPLPGAVNFCFGGPERDVLFITTDTAVWAAALDAKGP